MQVLYQRMGLSRSAWLGDGISWNLWAEAAAVGAMLTAATVGTTFATAEGESMGAMLAAAGDESMTPQKADF